MKEKAISRLKSMLSWSDRLGSDERDEILQIIKILETKEDANS